MSSIIEAVDQANFDSAARQAFSLQYISLIIIVLALIVGSFTGLNFIPAKSPPAPTPPQASQSHAEMQSVLQYSDLFLAHNTQINHLKAQALAALLLSHDLTAHIEINNGICLGIENEVCLALELAAGNKLKNYFIQQGLSLDDFSIFYSRDLEPNLVQIKFLEPAKGVYAK